MLLCIQPIFKIVTAACLFSPLCSGTSKNRRFPPPCKSDSRFSRSERGRLTWTAWLLRLNRRYESLTEKNDPLVAIAAVVPFESFRPKLNAALIKGELRRSEAERKNSADAALG